MITDFPIIEELQTLIKTDFEKADSIVSGFKKGANLEQMREFWHAKTPKAKAKIIKKHWYE